jgi:hypothetical protein
LHFSAVTYPIYQGRETMMLKQVVKGFKQKLKLLLPLLIGAILFLVTAQCGVQSPPGKEGKNGSEVTIEAKSTEGSEIKTVTLELAQSIGNPMTITLVHRQPLQLAVVDSAIPRRHFWLEIASEAYPDGEDFALQVTAIPSATIIANFEACQKKEVECEYPEVVGLTEDRRPIVEIKSERFVTANPYDFSVNVFDQNGHPISSFNSPITISISVDLLPEDKSQDHGIILYHSDDRTIENFPARLTEDEGGSLLVTNSTDIYRLSRMKGHCSSGPTCLKPKE